MILTLSDGTDCRLLLQANRGGAIDLQFVSKKEEGTFYFYLTDLDMYWILQIIHLMYLLPRVLVSQ